MTQACNLISFAISTLFSEWRGVATTMMRRRRYLIHHHRLRCDWAFGEGLMAPFTPPTSRNIFAGVLAATSAGDPASTAINTASHTAGIGRRRRRRRRRCHGQKDATTTPSSKRCRRAAFLGKAAWYKLACQIIRRRKISTETARIVSAMSIKYSGKGVSITIDVVFSSSMHLRWPWKWICRNIESVFWCLCLDEDVGSDVDVSSSLLDINGGGGSTAYFLWTILSSLDDDYCVTAIVNNSDAFIAISHHVVVEPN